MYRVDESTPAGRAITAAAEALADNKPKWRDRRKAAYRTLEPRWEAQEETGPIRYRLTIRHGDQRVAVAQLSMRGWRTCTVKFLAKRAYGNWLTRILGPVGESLDDSRIPRRLSKVKRETEGDAMDRATRVLARTVLRMGDEIRESRPETKLQEATEARERDAAMKRERAERMNLQIAQEMNGNS